MGNWLQVCGHQQSPHNNAYPLWCSSCKGDRNINNLCDPSLWPIHGSYFLTRNRPGTELHEARVWIPYGVSTPSYVGGLIYLFQCSKTSSLLIVAMNPHIYYTELKRTI